MTNDNEDTGLKCLAHSNTDRRPCEESRTVAADVEVAEHGGERRGSKSGRVAVTAKFEGAVFRP
ncbi:hypothetical protein [Haladaptatus halobius]|uniref:hypothetical protein n=1 Tax=Haladaptatus halobius TaxID=2884875 RepID=UPI001D0B2C7B|nr:hypothetical protein [Haladaptatus halobius]